MLDSLVQKLLEKLPQNSQLRIDRTKRQEAAQVLKGATASRAH